MSPLPSASNTRARRGCTRNSEWRGTKGEPEKGLNQCPEVAPAQGLAKTPAAITENQSPENRMQEQQLLCLGPQVSPGIWLTRAHFHHLPTTATSDQASLRLSLAIQASLWFKFILSSMEWNCCPVWERFPVSLMLEVLHIICGTDRQGSSRRQRGEESGKQRQCWWHIIPPKQQSCVRTLVTAARREGGTMGVLIVKYSLQRSCQQKHLSLLLYRTPSHAWNS